MILKTYQNEANRLKKLVTEKALHKDSSMSKQKMCKILGLTLMKLHLMFTRNFDMSYSDFINNLRVIEAKKLLADPTHRDRKKVEIARLSGFGSLSQFNVMFKRISGMTPSEYSVFHRNFVELTGENPPLSETPELELLLKGLKD
ncbi:MAG: helix-turn-helix domain-containing protein [Balneolaceae bacterium]